MRTFNYHAYNLPIDECGSQHGFWLDHGEEKRIITLMGQRVKDLKRSDVAQDEWNRLLRRMRVESFVDRFKRLFK